MRNETEIQKHERLRRNWAIFAGAMWVAGVALVGPEIVFDVITGVFTGGLAVLATLPVEGIMEALVIGSAAIATHKARQHH
ncbi:MAG TPA: hypothetical protein VEW42_06145 [Candidatus Eisenbacteria bacterium]|nr:hypothetical protein [Candidatus Eisenbacteria bacterium]